MKKIYNLVLVPCLLLLSLGAISQPPPPPANPATENGGNAPVGAPVGSGTIILISLAAAYAGRKAYLNHIEDEQK